MRMRVQPAALPSTDDDSVGSSLFLNTLQLCLNVFPWLQIPRYVLISVISQVVLLVVW